MTDTPPPRHRAGAAAASGDPGRWADLSRRIASTVVLLSIGVALALATGLWLRALIAAMIGVTFWELARMTGWRHPEMHGTLFGRARPVALATLAAASLMAAWLTDSMWLVVIPVLAGLPGAARGHRVPFALFGLAILFVGEGLVFLRESLGLGAVLWMMGVVVISDTLGYFAGRILGGPKFWPAVSPKKTWSGTAAGWFGAALFGLGLVLGGGGWAAISLVWLSPVIAFAGQLGDLAESWLKRRVGVKDSSSLIPGHGGFMDRFDAVSGAVLATTALHLLGLLPITAG